MSGAHMEDCQACGGNGYNPWAGTALRCGECRGAGTVEVWDDEDVAEEAA